MPVESRDNLVKRLERLARIARKALDTDKIMSVWSADADTLDRAAKRIAELEAERDGLSDQIESAWKLGDKQAQDIIELSLALVEERERRQWRTIDSAPKDGRDVLLYFPLEGLSSDWPRVIIGHWRDIPNAGRGYWVRQGRAVSGYSEGYQPTYWKPLDIPDATAIRSGKPDSDSKTNS